MPPTDVLLAAAALAPCPDCDSDVSWPTQDPDGIWHVSVSHDDTCPRFRAMTE